MAMSWVERVISVKMVGCYGFLGEVPGRGGLAP